MAKAVRDNARPMLDAREAMERLNAEASKLHMWLRTQANAPAQRPWFRDTGLQGTGEIAGGRVGAALDGGIPAAFT